VYSSPLWSYGQQAQQRAQGSSCEEEIDAQLGTDWAQQYPRDSTEADSVWKAAVDKALEGLALSEVGRSRAQAILQRFRHVFAEVVRVQPEPLRVGKVRIHTADDVPAQTRGRCGGGGRRCKPGKEQAHVDALTRRKVEGADSGAVATQAEAQVLGESTAAVFGGSTGPTAAVALQLVDVQLLAHVHPVAIPRERDQGRRKG
jgi:hypothetical protein